MAPGSRRRPLVNNPFIAPSLVRGLDQSKLFFVCEDLLQLFARLKLAPGVDTFDDPAAYLQFILDSPSRTCQHSHRETSILVLLLCVPEVAEILHAAIDGNVVQQIASYPRLSVQRFLQLLHRGDLGESFVSTMKSCSCLAKKELVQTLECLSSSIVLEKAGVAVADLVYFLQSALKVVLPGEITPPLRKACEELATDKEQKAPISLVLAESLCIVLDNIVAALSKANRREDSPRPSEVAKKIFKDSFVGGRELPDSNTDNIEFLVSSMGKVMLKTELPNEEAFERMMKASISDRIVDFAINCCDAAAETGLISLTKETRVTLMAIAEKLMPFSRNVQRICGADLSTALNMLKNAPRGFYRDAVFKELLKNPSTYEEKGGAFFVEVLEAGLSDGRKLSAEEAVLALGNLQNSSLGSDVLEKTTACLKDMEVEEVLKLLGSFERLDEAERLCSFLKTEVHERNMVMLWNRATESTLEELLPEFMVACLVDPKGTLERAVESAAEKPGKVGLSCSLLTKLSPTCRLTVTYEANGEEGLESAQEGSLLVGVLYNKWIQASSSSTPNVRRNLTNLASRLVTDEVLDVVEVYNQLVYPVLEAALDDYESGSFACRLLESILENDGRRGELTAPGITMWDVLKLVWIAHDDVWNFCETGEDGCSEEPVLHLQENLHQLMERMIRLLSDATDAEWLAFHNDSELRERLAWPLSLVSIYCPFKTGTQPSTVGGVASQYHRVTYMRDGDNVCPNCGYDERFDVADTMDLAMALRYCHERDIRRFFDKLLLLWHGLEEDDCGRGLRTKLQLMYSLVRIWSCDGENVQEKMAKSLVRPMMESLKALLAKISTVDSPDTERQLGTLGISYLEGISSIMALFSSSALKNRLVWPALLDTWTTFLNCDQMTELVPKEELLNSFLVSWLPLLDKLESGDEAVKQVDELLGQIRSKA